MSECRFLLGGAVVGPVEVVRAAVGDSGGTVSFEVQVDVGLIQATLTIDKERGDGMLEYALGDWQATWHVNSGDWPGGGHARLVDTTHWAVRQLRRDTGRQAGDCLPPSLTAAQRRFCLRWGECQRALTARVLEAREFADWDDLEREHPDIWHAASNDEGVLHAREAEMVYRWLTEKRGGQ